MYQGVANQEQREQSEDIEFEDAVPLNDIIETSNASADRQVSFLIKNINQSFLSIVFD